MRSQHNLCGHHRVAVAHRANGASPQILASLTNNCTDASAGRDESEFTSEFGIMVVACLICSVSPQCPGLEFLQQNAAGGQIGFQARRSRQPSQRSAEPRLACCRERSEKNIMQRSGVSIRRTKIRPHSIPAACRPFCEPAGSDHDSETPHTPRI